MLHRVLGASRYYGAVPRALPSPCVRALSGGGAGGGAVSVSRQLQTALHAAVASVVPDVALADVAVTLANSKTDADYQSNAALRLAKSAKVKPRDLAESIASSEAIRSSVEIADVTVSGPGFLNVYMSDAWIAGQVHALATCGLPRASPNVPGVPVGPASMPDRADGPVLVDFASPNMGKELHIGHMRSSVIGDSLCRILEYLGYTVDRVSHVGDIGLPACLVVAELQRRGDTVEQAACLSPAQLSECYIQSKRRHRDDATHKQLVNEVLHTLQSSAASSSASVDTTVALWQAVCQASRRGFEGLFAKLHVDVKERGESVYVDKLPALVSRLLDDGVAEHTDGAVGVFNGAGDDPPMLLRKSDGSYLYATVDVAALIHRAPRYQWLIYVVDASQSYHFERLFDLGRTINSIPSYGSQHSAFGVVQGQDGRKLSSRDGTDATLSWLLSESCAAAASMLNMADERLAHLSREEQELLADTIGCCAVRFYDLVHHRTSNYVFDIDSALEFKGRSAVYLMYAIARIRSIQRKLGVATESKRAIEMQHRFDSSLELYLQHRIDSWEELIGAHDIELSLCNASEPERALARILLQVADVIQASAGTATPSTVAEYALSVARAFHAFYDACYIVGNERQAERILLCAATEAVLRRCMSLLGVVAPEQL